MVSIDAAYLDFPFTKATPMTAEVTLPYTALAYTAAVRIAAGPLNRPAVRSTFHLPRCRPIPAWLPWIETDPIQ